MMQEWRLRKVDRIESTTKRKAREAKNREFFEKVFPELRKQREDKERFNRVGARADMEEIMDNLQEQALEDKKMRSYAVIPPILLDQGEKKIKYKNNNGFVEDMEAVYKSRQFLNVWTPSEKEIFKDKYLLHPKNFGIIASYLDRKSVSDCVQYYYLSVTTRLQREQQAKTVGQQPRDPHSGEPTTSTTPPATSATTAPTTSTATSPLSTSSTTTTPMSTNAPLSCASSTFPSTNTASMSTVTALVSSSNTTASSATSLATTGVLTTAISNCVSTSTSVISTSSSAGTASSVVVSMSNVNVVSAGGDKDSSMDTSDDAKPKGLIGFGALEDFMEKGAFFGEEAGSKEGGGVILDGQRQSIMLLDSVTVKKENESPQEIVSDQNMTCSTMVTESKKKKERRKDKDTAIETSDEEANSIQ
ncbi:hypothetical protein NQ314_007253, partial [Rhamnusium bicolor]